MPIPLLLLAGEAAVGYGVRTVASYVATDIGSTILSSMMSGALKSLRPNPKDLEMAEATGKAVSVRGGNSGAKANIPVPKGRLRKLADILAGLGLWELATAAVDLAPEYLETLYNSLAGSGVDPEKLAKLSKDDARQVVLVESAKQGVRLDGGAGLTIDEASKYTALLKSFGHELSEKHDKNQVSRPTTGDVVVDSAAFNHAMNRSAARLGLTGAGRFRQLYELAMVFNSIRESDIESIELHELQYGAIRVR